MIGSDLADDVMGFGEVGIFAAGAVGRVGKHGDFWLTIGVFGESSGGVFDNGIELLLSWLFVDAAVGEGEDLVAFLANEAAREVFGFERKMVFVGEENIARSVVEAGNHGIGFVVYQHSDGVIEIVGGEEFDIFEMASGGLRDLVSDEFGEDDFHEIIITCYNRSMRILENPTTKQELIDASTNFIDENTIKSAVDIRREIMAVDSPMHYDCEQLLIENGSAPNDIWGVNLYLDEENIDDMVEFDSMINIRPAQNNRTRSVEDPEIQAKIKSVVSKWIV